ncbi:heavy-metal-associated domain-containing protein [Nitrolancea hollandica]|nr:heavy metal-associated domain-containing protein [Nitrolancea hollandica]
MTTHAYHVPDISCQHCVNSITKELSMVPGVRHINVDLATKVVTVEADESVPDTQLRAGIEEAGYDITD